jgi:hypothetical protein
VAATDLTAQPPWLACRAAIAKQQSAAMTPTAWRTTEELCQELAISRSTLSRWRTRGLLRAGYHWVGLSRFSGQVAKLYGDN